MWFFNGRDKDIGLALGGGGAKGLAHIGILKVLEEKKYNIKYIAGTSAGSLIGGLYAYFKDAKKVEGIFLEQDIPSVVKAFSDIGIKQGIVKGDRLKELIEKYVGNAKIEDLDIKFAAVATDIINAKKVVFRKGKLSDAIVASCSIPFLFKPSDINNKILLDGGLVEPVPVKTVKDMGAKKVLAVDLNSGEEAGDSYNTLVRSFEIMQMQSNKEQLKDIWKVIIPKFNGPVSLLEFTNGEDIIKKGEEEARKMI